nr:hypothetical protein CFP56_31661 [Quercus suber]
MTEEKKEIWRREWVEVVVQEDEGRMGKVKSSTTNWCGSGVEGEKCRSAVGCDPIGIGSDSTGPGQAREELQAASSRLQIMGNASSSCGESENGWLLWRTKTRRSAHIEDIQDGIWVWAFGSLIRWQEREDLNGDGGQTHLLTAATLMSCQLRRRHNPTYLTVHPSEVKASKRHHHGSRSLVCATEQAVPPRSNHLSSALLMEVERSLCAHKSM